MNRKIKRYLIDYFFSVVYCFIFYIPIGLIFGWWDLKGVMAYASTNIFISLFSGRFYGHLLNKWRNYFKEGHQ